MWSAGQVTPIPSAPQAPQTPSSGSSGGEDGGGLVDAAAQKINNVGMFGNMEKVVKAEVDKIAAQVKDKSKLKKIFQAIGQKITSAGELAYFLEYSNQKVQSMPDPPPPPPGPIDPPAQQQVRPAPPTSQPLPPPGSPRSSSARPASGHGGHGGGPAAAARQNGPRPPAPDANGDGDENGADPAAAAPANGREAPRAPAMSAEKKSIMNALEELGKTIQKLQEEIGETAQRLKDVKDDTAYARQKAEGAPGNVRAREVELQRAGEEKQAFVRQLDDLRQQIKQMKERVASTHDFARLLKEQFTKEFNAVVDRIKTAISYQQRNAWMEILRAMLAAQRKLHAVIAGASRPESSSQLNLPPLYTESIPKDDSPAQEQQAKSQDAELAGKEEELNKRASDPYPDNKIREAKARLNEERATENQLSQDYAQKKRGEDALKAAYDSQRAKLSGEKQKADELQKRMQELKETGIG